MKVRFASIKQFIFHRRKQQKQRVAPHPSPNNLGKTFAFTETFLKCWLFISKENIPNNKTSFHKGLQLSLIPSPRNPFLHITIIIITFIIIITTNYFAQQGDPNGNKSLGLSLPSVIQRFFYLQDQRSFAVFFNECIFLNSIVNFND